MTAECGSLARGACSVAGRRELGLDVSWDRAFQLLRSPSRGAILALGALLALIYFVWLAVAFAIYALIFGRILPDSLEDFAQQVLTTSQGWTLIIVGCGVGFLFAVAVLAIGAVSFPMLIDRDVNAMTAIRASVHAFQANPTTMLMWGAIVVGLLVAGALPLLVGLAIVLPVLGHATWHLYRKLVAD